MSSKQPHLSNSGKLQIDVRPNQPKIITLSRFPIKQINANSRPTTAQISKPPQKALALTLQNPMQSRSIAPRIQTRPQTAQASTIALRKIAIQSKIAATSKTQTISKAPKESQIQLTCRICLDVLGTTRRFRITTCGALFHFDCMKAYLSNCISTSSLRIKCPDIECKSVLTNLEFSRLLPKPELDALIKQLKIKEARENPSKFTFCSTPDCPHIFSIPEKDAVALQLCPVCMRLTCLFCKVSFHRGYTCEEHKNQCPDELETYNEFFKKHWTRCPSCLFWVERIDGCDHIECHCLNEFCYMCGSEWKTCPC